ncbi:MAG: DUF192 domain-containing protein [Alphaproteobacteria bacterium]|nr:DUF192 domain-containing protein [Alphaproteobacteria bacterium]MBU1550662.1 DUF192 domain-containing protein [Alphaproteobacteria bacterium]MBU2338798.1 DUF192 domain-containing protein [Alphaproteobacteria bacterium]MBU2386889.1 DUF192 domain-containing protein [Alphaproteobacteria bacterium]
MMRIAMSFFRKGALAALFVLLASVASAQLQFDREELVIETQDGKRHAFDVELALTPEQRSQGLMHRESMPPDHGMLFDFDDTRPVSMWMQNTPLPLDMLFIQKDGTISHIHEMAVPFSQAIIDSRGPVSYVLELNGGRADALGITSGDRVISPRIEAGR